MNHRIIKHCLLIGVLFSCMWVQNGYAQCFDLSRLGEKNYINCYHIAKYVFAIPTEYYEQEKDNYTGYIIKDLNYDLVLLSPLDIPKIPKGLSKVLSIA